MRVETLAVHAGREIDPATGAITPPIHLSTIFERAPDGLPPRDHVYSQMGNPTRDQLERCLAQLEGGAAAATFASGSAATAAVFGALAPGDRVLLPDHAYHGTGELAREVFTPWGICFDTVDMTDLAAVRCALRGGARLVWIESPSNPALAITDIAAVAAIARQAGAVSVCDNTWATPALQRPLDLGADLTVHSTAKYLGGHSDTLGGAVVTRDEGGLFARIRYLQNVQGTVPSPFECWLVLRGIRTLALRMRAVSEGAARVATFLDSHPAVARVWYPGLEGHHGHDVAARQMREAGGMLLFQVKGVRPDACAVASRLRLFVHATSLGGTESLVEHSHALAELQGPGAESCLRLSVGLEHPDDLIADLAQALDSAGSNAA